MSHVMTGREETYASTEKPAISIPYFLHFLLSADMKACLYTEENACLYTEENACLHTGIKKMGKQPKVSVFPYPYHTLGFMIFSV